MSPNATCAMDKMDAGAPSVSDSDDPEAVEVPLALEPVPVAELFAPSSAVYLVVN